MQLSMNAPSRWMVLGPALFACSFLSNSTLRAQDGGCTDATFQGLYGLSVEGVVLFPEAPAPMEFKVAGLMEADGAGTLTVFRQMTNAGGQVFPIDWAAAAQSSIDYSVNADCTANIEFFVPGDSGVPIVPPEGLPFGASIVLTNGGRQANGIQTSPPNAILHVSLSRTDAADENLRADTAGITATASAIRELLERVAVRLGLVP